MLPLNVTPPFPVVPSTPFDSALAAVFDSRTSMTVDVSLYFADRPRSWHSKTCRESHVPVGADPSPARTGSSQQRKGKSRGADTLFFIRTTPAKLISFP